MDRLLAGPPTHVGRATFRKVERAGNRARRAFSEASPPLSFRHAGSARAARGIGRAPVQPAFMAIGVCAIQDTKKEDFLDKTTTAPAEFVRIGPQVLFTAQPDDHARRLFRTDGTCSSLP